MTGVCGQCGNGLFSQRRNQPSPATVIRSAHTFPPSTEGKGSGVSSMAKCDGAINGNYKNSLDIDSL